MKIIGWIRVGDRAACGGKVIEGLENVTSYDVAMSFQGAQIACDKKCHIGEAHPAHTLPNGRNQPHHGHRSVPGNCPLISTLNEIHGRLNDAGGHVPETFVEHNGEWIEAIYDEQFLIKDEEGNLICEMPYTIRLSSNELIHGVTDQEGRTARHLTNGAQRVEVLIGHIE